jgi:site-specific recombinase XerD
MAISWISGRYKKGYLESPLRARIEHVAKALVDRRYLDVVVRQHVYEWLRFASYLLRHGQALPVDARSSVVRRYLSSRLPHGSASRIRFVRASIRILLETDARGHFRRRSSTAVPRPVVPWFDQWIPAYLTFLHAHRGLSEATDRRRLYHLSLFAQFLQRLGVTAMAAITATHVQDFCRKLTSVRPSTRLTYGSSLRSFLRWAHLQGLMCRDLSAATITAQHVRQRGLPDVLSQDDLARLLAAVDLTSAVGRRDHAVLLLAGRYGLRPSDIRQLCLEHVEWRHGRIVLRQSKTGQILSLPLLPDVAAALSSYLRDGRPKTDSRHVFVRHRAPFEPFVPANNLSRIMQAALSRAGLAHRRGRQGLSLLRHSLATQLLGAGQPLKAIGDVLGHVHLDSTLIYAKVDLVTLRTVAISHTDVCR